MAPRRTTGKFGGDAVILRVVPFVRIGSFSVRSGRGESLSGLLDVGMRRPSHSGLKL
jgi:hypothetical protein